jgi:hypothetical protein
MIRRPSTLTDALLGLALTAIVATGCGGSASSPSGSGPAGSPEASTQASAEVSVPPSQPSTTEPDVSASPTDNLGFQHVNAALEDTLPSVIGNVQLEKMSLPLTTYLASSNGGDKVLYAPWLVKLGKTPDEVDIALATDLTDTENFLEQAIQVPDATATSLRDTFEQVARDKKWPVASRSVGDKSLLVVIDPTSTNAGMSTAHVYASKNVMYLIVTDDANLLVEAVARLP